MLLLVAALLLRIDGLSTPSLSTRELHNALLAREYYLGDGAGLPAWKQRVLTELGRSVKPIEPPLLDHVAAWSYRLTAGEHLWFPRLVSAFLWVAGGVFLYLIALRVTRIEGAIVALALYLFWPYGVVMSRLYIPDPMMVALILGGSLAIVRYWEQPSRRRFAVASSVAALATAAKPGIGLIFLVAVFTSLALSQGSLSRALVRGTLPLFAVLAAAPTAAYFVYGSYVRHFLKSEGNIRGRFQPELVDSRSFWAGWWHQLEVVLPFPQPQHALALVPLAAAAVGVVVARRGAPRAILLGLGLGYVAYAISVAGFTRDNAYYALPLLPILALAIGAFAGWVRARAPVAQRLGLAGVAVLALLVVAVGAYKSRPGAGDRIAIADYRRIGEITHHTTDAVIVDERLRTPAMYYGWIVGHYWYLPTPGRNLPLGGNPFPPWIDPAQASYLVVVDMPELQSEPRLRAFTHGLPVIASTSRYAVFDLRGGRALVAARSVSRE